MCCLKYEYQIYKDAKINLPTMGSIVTTPKGPTKVTEVNVIRESITGFLEDGSQIHCLVSELTGWETRCGGCCARQSPVAVEECKPLESNEESSKEQRRPAARKSRRTQISRKSAGPDADRTAARNTRKTAASRPTEGLTDRL